jgi:hypothetical protein
MPKIKPSPLQISFFRAWHAHAGVLVILSLICQVFVEHATLEPGFAWLVRIGVPLSATLIPLGFFLSVAFTPDRPNKWIWSLYAVNAMTEHMNDFPSRITVWACFVGTHRETNT